MFWFRYLRLASRPTKSGLGSISARVVDRVGLATVSEVSKSTNWDLDSPLANCSEEGVVLLEVVCLVLLLGLIFCFLTA